MPSPDRKSFSPDGKVKLSNRQLRAIQQQKMNRRRFLQKVGLGAVGLIAAAGGGAALYLSEDGEQERDFVTIEGQGEFDAETKKTIVKAARDWDTMYGSRDVTITPITQDMLTPQADGTQIRVLEEAEPGLIKVNTVDLVTVRNTILHAMTHANKPDLPTMLPEPIRYSDGVVRGYHGLNILVTRSTGEETMFTKIEEGMCERNALRFPDYYDDFPPYQAVGELTKVVFPLDDRRGDTLVKNNDVPGFIRQRYNVTDPAEPITGELIDAVIMDYLTMWELGESAELHMQENQEFYL